MKAVVFEIRQGLSSLRYSEAPEPELAGGDILVDVSPPASIAPTIFCLKGKVRAQLRRLTSQARISLGLCGRRQVRALLFPKSSAGAARIRDGWN